MIEDKRLSKRGTPLVALLEKNNELHDGCARKPEGELLLRKNHAKNLSEPATAALTGFRLGGNAALKQIAKHPGSCKPQDACRFPGSKPCNHLLRPERCS